MTEVRINEARESYRPAAERASLLYFILNDLNKINPIYQFSLKVTAGARTQLAARGALAAAAAGGAALGSAVLSQPLPLLRRSTWCLRKPSSARRPPRR